MDNIIIAGKKCETCRYGMIDENNIKVHCDARNKTYCYGQYVSCEDYKKKGWEDELLST